MLVDAKRERVKLKRAPTLRDGLVEPAHHHQIERVEVVYLIELGIQPDGALGLSFGAGPITVIDQFERRISCMRLGESVVQLQRLHYRRLGLRPSLVRWQYTP